LCGRWFPADSTSPPARWDSLFAAAGGAGFLDSLFDRFAGFARALLNPANQFRRDLARPRLREEMADQWGGKSVSELKFFIAPKIVGKRDFTLWT
jgi:hypothetical protein